MNKYDFVIVGSGSGLMVTEAALDAGKKVALIESAKIGGTCLTKGCIPSKMLVYPADLIREAQAGPDVGLTFTYPDTDWDVISKRVWTQINYHKRIESNLRKMENLDVYKGFAEFTGHRTMKVKYSDGTYSDEFEGENFIIAAGARSFVPDIPGLLEAGYLTSETFFGDKYPDKPYGSLAILGGGAIGAEFAHIFSSMQTKVSVIETNSRILKLEEPEVSELVHKQFIKDGIDIYTDSITQKVTIESGKKVLHLKNMKTEQTDFVMVDEILVAAGVISNADTLKLENTLIETDQKGYIITNEYQETNIPYVWAIGDINGKYQFRHTANKEAEILVHNLFVDSKNKKAVNYNAVPWAIFTHPQVAHAGMTEEQVKQCTDNYKVGINKYSDVVAGMAMGYSKRSDVNGFVKLIVADNKSILGAHVVGPNASILIQSYVYLMNCDKQCDKKTKKEKNVEIKDARRMCPHLGTYTPMDESMVIHPALSELTAWVTEELE